MEYSQERFHWYLHVAIRTWITKPYLFEEYESQRRYKFGKGQYMKNVKLTFALYLLKKIVKNSQLTLDQENNT